MINISNYRPLKCYLKPYTKPTCYFCNVIQDDDLNCIINVLVNFFIMRRKKTRAVRSLTIGLSPPVDGILGPENVSGKIVFISLPNFVFCLVNLFKSIYIFSVGLWNSKAETFLRMIYHSSVVLKRIKIQLFCKQFLFPG